MNITTISTQERKCGRRKEHGVYAVGGTETSADGVLLPFTLVDPPVPYQVKLHRGPRLVNAYAILGREPMENWWTGSSKNTEEKKAGDAWAIDVFGMTLSKRLEVGECAGAADTDEALAILAGKIRLNPDDRRLASYIRDMNMYKITELSRVVVHFEAFQGHLMAFVLSHTVGDLMAAQAALWRVAYNLPPTRRDTFMPFIQRILMLMNLPKDAVAVKSVFGG